MKLTLSGILFLLILTSGTIVTKIIRRPITALTSAIFRLQKGEFISPLPKVLQTVISREKSAAEEITHETSEKLKHIVDYSPTIIFTCDAIDSFKITYISKNVESLLGYTPADFLMDEYFILNHIHPDDKMSFTLNIANIFKKDELLQEYRLRNSKGKYRWIAYKLRIIRNDKGNIIELIGSMSDISLRKEAENSRKNLENMLSKAQQIAHIGSWEWDIATNKMEMSKETYQIYGLSDNQFDGTYDAYLKLFPERDIELVSSVINEALLNQAEYDVEHQAIRPDGIEIIVREKGELIRDGYNRPVKMIAVVHDVTIQKNIEKTEREYQILLHGILNSLEANIAVLDNKGLIINVNEAWNRFAKGNGNIRDDILGVGADYLNVCKIAMLNKVEGAHVVYNGIKAILDKENNYFTFEYPCHSPQRPRWFLMQATPLMTKSGGVVVSHIDITERVLANVALQKATARVETLLESNPTVIFSSDPSGDFTINFISDNVKLILGYEVSEVEGRVDFWYEHIHPDDRINIFPTLPELFDEGVYTHEYRFLHKDGKYRWMHNQMRLLATGEKQEIIGSLTDITERKEYEVELIAFRDQLQEMVNEQTKDLIEARDAALSAERSMSTFLSNMSHELRSPLHGILSYASFGLTKYETASNEKLYEYFNEIKDSGITLLNLVNNLLDLSKLRAGKMVYNYNLIDINQIIESVLHETSILTEQKGLVTRFIHNHEISLNLLDGDRIGQVVRNLLSNAMKFSPQNGVIEINVMMDRDSNTIVSITDQGMGIPDDELDYIFDAFVQSSKTRTNAGGTGLGLAICKEIIETGHQGWIKANNVQDRGACFTFLISNHHVNELDSKHGS